MPQDNKKNKTHIESLLSKQEAAKLSELRDIIIHAGKNPSLILIGTDSSALGEAFVDFVKRHSPIEVKPWRIDNQEEAFTILKNAGQLNPNCFHILCFFTNDSLVPDDDVSSLSDRLLHGLALDDGRRQQAAQVELDAGLDTDFVPTVDEQPLEQAHRAFRAAAQPTILGRIRWNISMRWSHAFFRLRRPKHDFSSTA